MMDELRNGFLLAVADSLATDGFKLVVSQQRFERKEPWGRQILHVMFNPKGGVLRAALEGGVRFDWVEELVNEFNPANSHSCCRTRSVLWGDVV